MVESNVTPQVDVLLVGYENQENLGLRSIMAFLLTRGYEVKLVPFAPGREMSVVNAFLRYRPRLGGFSLIFQYALEEFGHLMHRLRASGVPAHFTAGGHFPSLRPKETLEMLPNLDSVVRCEGELTLVELLENLDEPERWEDIRGLAFDRGKEVVLTASRPLIEDLDRLPPVYREQPRRAGNGILTASITASRGCLFNCSFCSIHQFYATAPGPLRRSRSPEAVADEMHTLFTKHGIELFMFQDDDFAARTNQQREWIRAFLHALATRGLADTVKWKISCRVDDLEAEMLTDMMAHGLMAVYLGVESGSERGLRTLGKGVTVARNLTAIDMVKGHDLALAMGFMLFDPESTFDTVRENIDFLQAVGKDGHFAINFCKMLPYAGTPIEARLQAAGRLCGTVARPDYNFRDPRLNTYAVLVQRIFNRRNFDPRGLVARLQAADFEFNVTKALRRTVLPPGYEAALRRATARVNRTAVETLATLLDKVLECDADELTREQDALVDVAAQEWQCEADTEVELARLERLMCLDRKQSSLAT